MIAKTIRIVSAQLSSRHSIDSSRHIVWHTGSCMACPKNFTSTKIDRFDR